jgi:hypothetical protein
MLMGVATKHNCINIKKTLENLNRSEVKNGDDIKDQAIPIQSSGKKTKKSTQNKEIGSMDFFLIIKK